MKQHSAFDNYHEQHKRGQSSIAKTWLKLIKRFPNLNEKIKITQSLPKKAKILDVGCGVGTFLQQVHYLRPDLQLYGVDVSSDPAQQLSKQITFHKASEDALPFKDNIFDLVISQHVLEHVHNPHKFIEEFRRVSKNYIIISTPNYKKTKLWDKYNFWSDPTHIRPYSKRALERLFQQQKLKVIRIKNTRDINVPCIALIPLFIVSLFSKHINTEEILANVPKCTTVGIAKK